LRPSKRSDAHGRSDAPGLTLRVVLDTCILKLATFPAENNASALIYELARADLIEAWVTPAILEEYADVLGDHPEFVAEIVESFPVCYPLTELSVIRHEPDNRFLECALAADADFIVTVNTAPGHFDRKQFQAVSVVRPGEFLNVPQVGRVVKKLSRG
jgi:predicted nucleic acid-binding protein